MNTYPIIPSEFDSNQFKIKQPDFSKNTTIKSAQVSYKNYAFRVQLPQMRTYGLSQIKDAKTGKPLNENKISFQCLLANMDTRTAIMETKQMFDKLQEIAVKVGTENSEAWFGTEFDGKVVKNFFKSNLKYPMKKDEKGQKTKEINTDYPPSINFSLYINDGKITCDAVDMKNRPIDVNNVDLKNALIIPIVQINNMWIGNNMFGYTWKVIKMQVLLQSKSAMDIGFRNDLNGLICDGNEDENDDDVDGADVDKESSQIHMKKVTLSDSE